MKMDMTQINHHLTDGLLMGYSAGTLPEAFNLVVASHISLCDECRARMHEFDAVGGAIMEQQGDVPMGEGAFAATMAMINSGPEMDMPAPPRNAPSVLPQPVRDYVGGDLDSVTWRKIGGGVSQAVLPTTRDASVRLLKIPAGVAVPDHGHRGTELTLVLQGAFEDESDRFAAGDIEVANEEMVHQPVAKQGEDCICLAATDAPLRFMGLIPRIAQRVLRI